MPQTDTTCSTSNGNVLNDFATRYRETGDEAAGKVLHVHFRRYILSFSRKYCSLAGGNLPHDDVVSDGNFGFVDALRKYNQSKGDFEPYCKQRIWGEIKNGIRKRGKVSLHMENLLRILREAEEKDGMYSSDERILCLQKNGTSRMTQKVLAVRILRGRTQFLLTEDGLMNRKGGNEMPLSDILKISLFLLLQKRQSEMNCLRFWRRICKRARLNIVRSSESILRELSR